MAAGSVTVPNYFQNSDKGTNYYRSRKAGIYRPAAASSADYWRKAGDLTNSSGLLAHTGLNYSDTTATSETIEIWYHLREEVRPDVEILAALNRALEWCFFDTCYEALSHIHHVDGAMILSTDTDWTDVGTPTTSAKSTTARRTPWGLRSYQLISDAAGEGTQSATIPWDTDEEISAWTIASADAGTARFQPYDVTGTAAFGTAVDYTGELPAFLKQDWVSPPASSEEGALQLLAQVNPSTVFFNMAWLYKRNQLRIELDGHLEEGFEIIDIYQAEMGNAVATSTYRAQDVNLRLVPKSEYRVVMSPVAAVPAAVQFTSNRWFDSPLFMQTRRPYSDEGTLSTEASTTNAPLHLLIPRAKIEILENCIDEGSYDAANPVKNWAYQRLKAEKEWQQAKEARPPQEAVPPQQWGGMLHRV